MIKKVAILTSGGDASGMNSTIRAIVKASRWKNIEPYLVYGGFKGLTEGKIKSASDINVDDFMQHGGTFIHSIRYSEFLDPKVREKAKEQLNKMDIEALVVIGGNGSYQGAQSLNELGIKTIAVPGTIDNDISSTDYTVGFFTAMETIVQNVDRLRDTANSHHRCIIVEVMGRHAGDLATFAGVATGAELIITNEQVYNAKEIAQIVKEQMIDLNKESMIVVTSEKIYQNLKQLAIDVEKLSGITTRSVILGHIQRGGVPTALERYLSTRIGTYTIELLSEGKSGLAVGVVNNNLTSIPIIDALSKPKPKNIETTTKFSKINQQK